MGARLHLIRHLLVLTFVAGAILATDGAWAQDNADSEPTESAQPDTSAGEQTASDEHTEDEKAEPSVEQRRAADRRYEIAVRLFGEGRYREAIDEFSRAIELSGEPVFYCNRGVAFIKVNEWDAALEDLHTCRSTFQGSPAELAQIDAQYRGLQAFVRGVRPRAIEVARDIATGQIEPTVVKVSEKESPWNVELLGHLSLGTGSVLLTTALTLDYLSADLREDFVEQSQGGLGTSEQRYRDLRDELETRQQVFTGLLISGAALAVTGISVLTYTWFIADEPSDQAPQAAELAVEPRDGGASLHLRLDF